jgi:pimeloyl-ACP methyl ester carboxylesterase
MRLGFFAWVGLSLLGPSAFSAETPCQVYLVPGAFGTGTSSLFLEKHQYFFEYAPFFKSKGCEVIRVEFPPNGKIEERGLVLRDQMSRYRKENGEGPTLLVAHSQGALDARYALRELGLSHVAALASVGAPNSGTPLADWVVKEQSHPDFVYWAFRILGRYDFRSLPFVGELTGEFLTRQAKHFEKVRGVAYGAAVGVCESHCSLPLRVLDYFSGLGPGDGLIPRDSQPFGEDLGTYDLDHISEVSTADGKTAVRQKMLTRIWKFFQFQLSHPAL